MAGFLRDERLARCFSTRLAEKLAPGTIMQSKQQHLIEGGGKDTAAAKQ